VKTEWNASPAFFNDKSNIKLKSEKEDDLIMLTHPPLLNVVERKEGWR